MLVKKYLDAVIPAKAGIYCMDPRLRGDDKIALTVIAQCFKNLDEFVILNPALL